MARNRWIYAAMMAVTVVVGLSTRSVLRPVIGSFWAANLGDALWAVLVFLLIVFIRPSISTNTAAITSMFVAVAIECSQLVQTPGLNQLRRETPVGLVIGYGFSWGDLVAYLCGIAAMWTAERWTRKESRSAPREHACDRMD